jgi:osmotically-inducible protein OsmY
MRRSLPRFSVLGLAGVAAAWGCSQQTIESATHDTARNAQIVAREVDRAKKKAEPQLKQLEIGARVQAALKANENLPLSIRVDADPVANGVKLRGTVKTEAQKTLAEKIARETLGPSKHVQNDLKVAGG